MNNLNHMQREAILTAMGIAGKTGADRAVALSEAAADSAKAGIAFFADAADDGYDKVCVAIVASIAVLADCMRATLSHPNESGQGDILCENMVDLLIGDGKEHDSCKDEDFVALFNRLTARVAKNKKGA